MKLDFQKNIIQKQEKLITNFYIKNFHLNEMRVLILNRLLE